MNRPFGRLFLASLTVVVLSGFALTPAAGARGGGGGGGGRWRSRRRWRRCWRRRWRQAKRATQQQQGRCAHQRCPQHQRQQRQRQQQCQRQPERQCQCRCRSARRLGSSGRRCDGRRRRDGGDCCRHRLDGDRRADRVRPDQLRRHDLSAVRQHVVSASGIAVRRGQSTVLSLARAPDREGINAPWRCCRCLLPASISAVAARRQIAAGVSARTN